MSDQVQMAFFLWQRALMVAAFMTKSPFITLPNTTEYWAEEAEAFDNLRRVLHLPR